jgi:hypothetical protein
MGHHIENSDSQSFVREIHTSATANSSRLCLMITAMMINIVSSGAKSLAQLLLRPPFIGGAIVLLLLSSVVFGNLAYAQVFPQSQVPGPTVSNQSHPSVSNKSHPIVASSQQPKAHNVKVTSPTKGQRVPVGKNLFVSGTSVGNSNPTSINCLVSVIVNGIKPYQPTSPAGPHGSGDYSKWSFVLTPKYTTIKEGQNKITAKYSCANNAAVLSHNSVNVTGVIGPGLNSTTAKVG